MSMLRFSRKRRASHSSVSIDFDLTSPCDAREHASAHRARQGSCSNVCPVKINIHDQIYGWREVMEEKHQIKLVKKEAMIVAGKVLSHPHLYGMAADATETSLKVLPRFALYNHLNAWGRHRDIPQPA